jgi:hypothetical protein
VARRTTSRERDLIDIAGGARHNLVEYAS